jgi:hypothetical protein
MAEPLQGPVPWPKPKIMCLKLSSLYLQHVQELPIMEMVKSINLFPVFKMMGNQVEVKSLLVGLFRSLQCPGGLVMIHRMRPSHRCWDLSPAVYMGSKRATTSLSPLWTNHQWSFQHRFQELICHNNLGSKQNRTWEVINQTIKVKEVSLVSWEAILKIQAMPPKSHPEMLDSILLRSSRKAQ